MFRFRHSAPAISVFAASSAFAICTASGNSKNVSKNGMFIFCDGELSNPRREDLRVVLSAVSLERVRSLAAKVGRDGYSAHFVAVRPSVTQREVMDYDELFARRVAFRVKGLAFADGFISAIGRLSVMEGEILAKDFVASLPIMSPEAFNSKDAWDLATYLPTSLRAHTTFNTPWSGVLRMPQSKGDLSIKYVPLSSDEEVLLGGIMWMPSLVDAEGNCKYQGEWRAKYPDIDPDLSKVTAKSPEARDVDVSATKCSVCRWLMSGPCFAEYEAWDKSMEAFNADSSYKEREDDFMESSAKMAACVKKHEYYDVYVAFL